MRLSICRQRQLPGMVRFQKKQNNNIFNNGSILESLTGSIAYILKPIGSAMSGWVAELIGRKRAMLLVNIPHIMAWTMLFYAQSTVEIFMAAILLGLGIGFMEAPVVTYVGEIW